MQYLSKNINNEIVGKWDNGIRVGLSEKMKVGANDSNEMSINLIYILL